MRINCMSCGKSVSSEVEGDVVVRAYVECPECIEKSTPKIGEGPMPLLFAIINAIGELSKDEAIDAILDRKNLPRILDELTAILPAAVSDEDIVMRFRSIAQSIEARLPIEAGESERERRSRVVAMQLRAAVESLVAHIGVSAPKVSYVVAEETKRAIANQVAQMKASKH